MADKLLSPKRNPNDKPKTITYKSACGLVFLWSYTNRTTCNPSQAQILNIKSQILTTFAQTTIMADQQPNQLNIEISEEIAEGVYANLAIITYSHAEFVVDFVNVMPGTPKSKVKSRIILTPQHAKRFMKALVDNVKRFEAANGPIQDIEEIQIPLNFGGPTAQA